jgi:hypothetical protein
MKKLIRLIPLLLLGSALSIRAQAAPLASLKFVMPTGVDPLDLTFTSDGQILSFFGRDTMPDPLDPEAPFGVEFRTNGILRVGGFQILPGQGSFVGDLGVTSQVDPQYESFTPWIVSPAAPFATLHAAPGSALVGDPDPILPLPGLPLHSILQYTGGLEGADLEAFRNQQFNVIAQAVPEPGAVAAMSCAALAAGSLLLRRRRR